MRDSVVYMRGPLPFGIDRGVSLDLVEDVKLTLEIEVELLNAIAGELQAYPGFLDNNGLKGLIGRYIPNEDHRNRLSRLVAGLDSRFRSTNQTINELIAQIQEWQRTEEGSKWPQLTPSELDELRNRLPLIGKRYPSLGLQSKAKRLSVATGLPLEELDIICDLRPVFDEDRRAVEGIIPFTTLKIVCNGVDGLPVALEAILTEGEVKDLVKKSTAAVEKLNRLHELLEAKGVRIPTLEMTKRGE